jgi:hypothetical protein
MQRHHGHAAGRPDRRSGFLLLAFVSALAETLPKTNARAMGRKPAGDQSFSRAAVAALLLLCPCLCQARGKIPQGEAQLTVEVRDRGSGKAVPARFYLIDEKGTPQTPAGVISYSRGEENHFLISGGFTTRLPAGTYNLTVERGPEFRSQSLSLTLKAGQVYKQTVIMDQWIDMNRRGWYSGDLHNHRKPEEMAAILLTENLNVAPAITDWIVENGPVSGPPASAQPVVQVDSKHVYSVFDKEIERLKNGPGAIILLQLRSPLAFEGYLLSPPDDSLCRQAHAVGGHVDAEKLVWRDTPALVALNQIDTVEILHNKFNPHGVDLETARWGMIPKDKPVYSTPRGMSLWSMDIYYRFLNCCFRLPVSAGSASGVKPSPPGYNRVYAHLGGSFSYDNWFKALKAGRSFATNGPMLFLTIDGKRPGAGLSLFGPGQKPLRVRAEALSAGRLDRLEIIYNGSVIQAVSDPKGPSRLSIDMEKTFDSPGWVVARCFEQPGRTIHFAHTSPIYLQAGTRAHIVPADAQFFVDWISREILFYKESGGFRSADDRDEMLYFFRKAQRIYSVLARRPES